MQKNTYKFDVERVVSLWLLPFLFGILVLILFIFKVLDYDDPITLVDVLVYLCLLIFSTGIFIFLFFNHLSYAKNVELITSDSEIEIIRNEKSVIIQVKNIEAIYEYYARRLPWSGIRKWIFVTTDDEVVVSSLTISWLDFHRLFSKKIVDKDFLFPTI